MFLCRAIIGISVFLFVLSAKANYEVERLLDSYIVAKADLSSETSSPTDLKDRPYTIQVASYVNERDAASHVEELKLQEKEVLYFPAFIRGQVWFKVCVGSFATKEEAERYRKVFTQRMDEPFTMVISRLDRPKGREPASLAKKERARLPVDGASEGGGESASGAVIQPEVKLIPKIQKVSKIEKVPKTEKASKSEKVSKAANYYYSLQVGAYPTEELAKKSAEGLPLKDQEVHYRSAFVGGKTWHRVFVGKFESKKEAEAFQKKFQEQVREAESFIRRVTASE